MGSLYRRRLSIPGMSEADDRLLNMAVAMASELAVMRERIDTLERLLAQAGVLAPDAVEEFKPDSGAQASRDLLRSRLITKVMKPVRDGAARDAEEHAEKDGDAS